MVRSSLSGHGLQGQFRLIQLDFGGAALAAVSVGDPVTPDLTVSLIETRWRWRGLGVELDAVRIVEPQVHLTFQPTGRLSAGVLERFRAGEGSGDRPRLPRIALTIENGTASIDAPMGVLTAQFNATGRIGQDFAARAQIADTTLPGQDYALEAGAAELILASRGETMSAQLNVSARRLVWAQARLGPSELDALVVAPLDLSRVRGETSWRLAALEAPSFGGRTIAGAAAAQTVLGEDGFDLRAWRAETRVNAGGLRLGRSSITAAQLNATVQGEGPRGAGAWSVSGVAFDGLALLAPRLQAAGDIAIEGGALNGQAEIALANARLSDAAQARVRRALPDIARAPIGPTFAEAERAFDDAADRFDLTAPVAFSSAAGAVRVSITRPIEARAATGARITIAPLRADTPTLLAQLPAGVIDGAAAIDLEGGGLPRVTLLFDAIDWSPQAPFTADGTLAIVDWSAQGARIASNEIGLGLTIEHDGRGRLELDGPVTITGPVGDGDVRDMEIALDLAVTWGGGWRVSPQRGCVPVRLGGLNVVGLSFAAGAFQLCPLQGGALIAANANGQLSEGFAIQSLGLNGRMAGPDAQPARLASARLTGRFSGTSNNVVLAVEAAAPSLAIDMGSERTLAVTGSRLTADARFGNGPWRIDGAFEQGAIDDPALPGEVTAIAGRWSAAPESDGAVVGVSAAEAQVTAHPASEADTRPLFNPLRLSEVSAIMRDGGVNASGLLFLDAHALHLATFTATHDIRSGAGGAHFVGDALQFGETMQPYQISELARGVLENVRGPASGSADVAWTREAVTATARVRLDGVSLALSTIPVIEDVRGEIVFDDLLTLHTPPGQAVTVGLVNPGIAVRNGRVRFQLLGEQRVAVEQAEFDFASGILALDPTIITLGADEAEVRLLLRRVDAATLLSQLNVADLRASGSIEGAFPLRLTRQTAYVANGELYAAPGGGVIEYTGQAGANATGPAKVAFDALRRFHYDNLRITLNGDISGEVVSSISFTGENVGEAVDLTEIAAIPGVGRVTARGVPFAFNVTVTAPFRRLAQTASGFVNPGEIIGEAMSDGEIEENAAPASDE